MSFFCFFFPREPHSQPRSAPILVSLAYGENGAHVTISRVPKKRHKENAVQRSPPQQGRPVSSLGRLVSFSDTVASGRAASTVVAGVVIIMVPSQTSSFCLLPTKPTTQWHLSNPDLSAFWQCVCVYVCVSVGLFVLICLIKSVPVSSTLCWLIQHKSGWNLWLVIIHDTRPCMFTHMQTCSVCLHTTSCLQLLCKWKLPLDACQPWCTYEYISVDCKVLLQFHFLGFFFFTTHSPRMNKKFSLPSFNLISASPCLLPCSSCFAGMAFDIKVAAICHSINTHEFNSAYALISSTKEAAASSLLKKTTTTENWRSRRVSYYPTGLLLPLNFLKGDFLIISERLLH